MAFQRVLTHPRSLNGPGVVISDSWGTEIHFWTEEDNWTNLEFEPTSNGKLEEP
jgi:hypothetical protein